MKNILSANLYNKNGIWLAQQEWKLLETICLFKIWDYGSCEDLYDAECKQVTVLYPLPVWASPDQTDNLNSQSTNITLTYSWPTSTRGSTRSDQHKINS